MNESHKHGVRTRLLITAPAHLRDDIPTIATRPTIQYARKGRFRTVSAREVIGNEGLLFEVAALTLIANGDPRSQRQRFKDRPIALSQIGQHMSQESLRTILNDQRSNSNWTQSMLFGSASTVRTLRLAVAAASKCWNHSREKCAQTLSLVTDHTTRTTEAQITAYNAILMWRKLTACYSLLRILPKLVNCPNFSWTNSQFAKGQDEPRTSGPWKTCVQYFLRLFSRVFL